MKKREIQEVLDSDGNLIGSDDQPANNTNQIGADGTTDHNAGIGHQHFAHDFLGRFGFYMYNEGEGDENASSTNELLMSIAREAYNYFMNDEDNPTSFEAMDKDMQDFYINFAKKVIGILNVKKEPIEPTLTESEISKMIEDVVTNKIDRSMFKKNNDNDILDSKVKDKLKSMLSKLSTQDKSELIKHLKK
jgi:uncharacterized protein (UPF0333 family)